MKTLVVLPSYNERNNIVALLNALLDLGPEFCVSVVDDSSPDGTAELLQKVLREDPPRYRRVDLLVRPGKGGRGGAVRAGFVAGLKRAEGFERFIEMDCDFSHEPSAIQQGLDLIDQGSPVVLGVRYPGGTIIGWPLGRRVFSFFANTLARVLIYWPIADYTNGFRFYTRQSVEKMLSHPQLHTGYIYLSETLAYLLADDVHVGTFPIVFRNRERGVSNTNLREIRNALFGLFQIAWKYRLGRL